MPENERQAHYHGSDKELTLSINGQNQAVNW
jgi:hypothetical protein